MTTTTTKTIFFKFGLSIAKGEEVEVLEAQDENYFRVRRKSTGTIIYTVHRKNLKL